MPPIPFKLYKQMAPLSARVSPMLPSQRSCSSISRPAVARCDRRRMTTSRGGATCAPKGDSLPRLLRELSSPFAEQVRQRHEQAACELLRVRLVVAEVAKSWRQDTQDSRLASFAFHPLRLAIRLLCGSLLNSLLNRQPCCRVKTAS